MPSQVLSLEDISHTYSARASRGGVREVLRSISLDIRRGEFLTILGPSGCGKTTLLRIIAGLLKPTSGRVRKSNTNRNIGSSSRTGFVFQSPNLLPWLTAKSNVRLPLRLGRGVKRLEKAGGNHAVALLEDLGLRDAAELYPSQLSLGMQMRVNLARALVHSPTLLVLDEPFSALDAVTWQRLQRDVLHMWRRLGITCVHVTHNIAEAVGMADRILLLSRRPARVVKEYRLEIPRFGTEPRLFEEAAVVQSQQILSDMQALHFDDEGELR